MALQTSRASTATASGQPPAGPSRRRRVVEAVAFIGIWMAAGYLLPISANTYLLLGIPLTFAFQTLVRRRPVRELFAGNTRVISLGTKGFVMAVVLALVPGYFAARALLAGDWAVLGWYLAAVAGAFFAAFSLRAGPVPAMLRSAAMPMAIGASGMTVVYGLVHVATGAPLPAMGALAAVAKYCALYFPAAFLLEEVAFRGAIDAHLHHEGERRGWPSAILVSALWGLWHLPVSSGLPRWLQPLELLVVHIVLGVPLSFAWRRSRNLAGPALAHAVNDAVRNALMLGL